MSTEVLLFYPEGHIQTCSMEVHVNKIDNAYFLPPVVAIHAWRIV
jgi:hypothetical protein